MNKQKIIAQLDSKIKTITTIEILSSINSTNSYLAKQSNKSPIQICLAEQQTAGKGRLDHIWYSPANSNIYLSCRYNINKKINLSGLSLVIGIAIIDTLKQLNITDNARIKWPNDIIWKDKKLAGILIETSNISSNKPTVIIGIGLNVNMQQATKHQIDKPWTSLNAITGKTLDRNPIVTALINNITAYLQEFIQNGFKQFQQQWKKYDYLFDKQITISSDKSINGTAIGVNDQGQLLIKTENQTVHQYISGEVVRIED